MRDRLGAIGRAESHRIDPERVAGRQQQVVEPAGLGGERDGSAMLEAGEQAPIGHAEELVVVVAQRGEPRDFARRQGFRSRQRFSPGGGQHGVPLGAAEGRSSSASAEARMRSGRCDPTIGIGRAGWAMIQARAAASRVAPFSMCATLHPAPPVTVRAFAWRGVPPPSGDHAITPRFEFLGLVEHPVVQRGRCRRRRTPAARWRAGKLMCARSAATWAGVWLETPASAILPARAQPLQARRRPRRDGPGYQDDGSGTARPARRPSAAAQASQAETR